jgi:hypothetical protein
MKLNIFSMAMVILLTAMASAVPIATDSDLATAIMRRQDNTIPVEFCDDINYNGCTWFYPQYGICGNLGEWAGISSVGGLQSGDWCVLFSNGNCQGSSVRTGNIADLDAINFNDVPSSYACYFPT